MAVTVGCWLLAILGHFNSKKSHKEKTITLKIINVFFVLVLLFALVKRFGVSRMRNYFNVFGLCYYVVDAIFCMYLLICIVSMLVHPTKQTTK